MNEYRERKTLERYRDKCGEMINYWDYNGEIYFFRFHVGNVDRNKSCTSDVYKFFVRTLQLKESLVRNVARRMLVADIGQLDP